MVKYDGDCRQPSLYVVNNHFFVTDLSTTQASMKKGFKFENLNVKRSKNPILKKKAYKVAL